MFNVLSLRANVESVVGDLLGTYQYENGFSRSAIAVDNPPNGIKITGLEVILPSFPQIDKSTRLTNTIYRNERWTITLIKREGCTAKQFTDACDRLSRYFTRSYLTYIPANDIVGSYTQAIIKFRFEDLYNEYLATSI